MRENETAPVTENRGKSASIEVKSISRVALSGNDYCGVNLELLCQQGNKVLAGAELMRDARRPEVIFTAPASGEVSRIERGARRRLVSLQIECEADEDSARFALPDIQDKSALRKFMLGSGAWASLRTRPFGNIPNPTAEPAAIFVTAIDNEPQAPLAAAIIDDFDAEFRAAVNTLAAITDAPVYVCHTVGCPPPVDESARVRCQAFTKTYTQGLPGTHINALCPIGFAGGEVWHIDYQETIALGYLLLHGRPWQHRILMLAGNALTRPRCLRVPRGASVNQLLQGEIADDKAPKIFSGSVEYGRRIGLADAFLNVGQKLLTVVDEASIDPPASGVDAVIPSEMFDSLVPPGIYAVPLMRALQVGDVDRARELGALELVEEDLAMLSRANQWRCDYGQLLRQVLGQLQGATQ
jgi:Na+-transporting NADH:ubiquinone oxidoreductase subunit A